MSATKPATYAFTLTCPTWCNRLHTVDELAPGAGLAHEHMIGTEYAGAAAMVWNGEPAIHLEARKDMTLDEARTVLSQLAAAIEVAETIDVDQDAA